MTLQTAWDQALAAATSDLAAAAKRGPFTSLYDPVELVAQGSKAKVVKVRCLKAPGAKGGPREGQELAARVRPNLGTKEQMGALAVEVAVHRLLGDHPAVARLLDVVVGGKEIYLLTELCDGGPLADYLAEGGLSEHAAAGALSQVLSLAAAAHSRGIVLRCLSTDALLLAHRGKTDVKIASFQSSAFCPPGAPGLTGNPGNPAYAAPEVLMRFPYGTPSDLWSIGVIATLLLTGRNPFAGVNLSDTIARVTLGKGVQMSAKEWEGVSPSAARLVGALLQADPSARPPAADALRSSWFTSPPSASLGPEAAAAFRSYVGTLRVQRLAKLVLTHALGAAGAHVARAARLKELHDLFTASDTDHDSRLSAAELFSMLSRLGGVPAPSTSGPSPPDELSAMVAAGIVDRAAFERLFAAADLDGSGGLDRGELCAALLDADAVVRSDEARKAAYAALDANKDGVLSAEELAAALGGADRAAARRAGADLVAAYDKDRDGAISLEEFIAMYKDKAVLS